MVNHKASIDPLLTIGDGSMNPDNLERKDKLIFFLIYDKFGQMSRVSVRPWCCMNFGMAEEKSQLCDKKKCGADSDLRECRWGLDLIIEFDAISLSVVRFRENTILKHGIKT